MAGSRNKRLSILHVSTCTHVFVHVQVSPFSFICKAYIMHAVRMCARYKRKNEKTCTLQIHVYMYMYMQAKMLNKCARPLDITRTSVDFIYMYFKRMIFIILKKFFLDTLLNSVSRAYPFHPTVFLRYTIPPPIVGLYFALCKKMSRILAILLLNQLLTSIIFHTSI